MARTSGGLILDRDVAPGAAISKSKLDGPGGLQVVDADVSIAAAIAAAKIAGTAETQDHKGAANGYMGLDGSRRGAQSPMLHGADHQPGGADALTALTDANFAPANVDGANNKPSLRMLNQGTGYAIADPGGADYSMLQRIGGVWGVAVPGTANQFRIFRPDGSTFLLDGPETFVDVWPGVTGDGSSNCTAGIQAAHAWMVATWGGGTLRFGPKTYVVDTLTSQDTYGVNWRGAGRGKSTSSTGSIGGTVLKLSGLTTFVGTADTTGVGGNTVTVAITTGAPAQNTYLYGPGVQANTLITNYNSGTQVATLSNPLVAGGAVGAPIFSRQIGVNFFSNTGSGNVTKFEISDMKITAHNGASRAIALQVWNGLHFTLEGLYLEGTICALSLQGSGNATVRDVEGYISVATTGVTKCAALWVGSGSQWPKCQPIWTAASVNTTGTGNALTLTPAGWLGATLKVPKIGDVVSGIGVAVGTTATNVVNNGGGSYTLTLSTALNGSGIASATVNGGSNDGKLTSPGPIKTEGACQWTCFAGVNCPARVFEATTAGGGGGLGGTGAFSIVCDGDTVNTEGGVCDGATVIDDPDTTVTVRSNHTESNWNSNSTGGDYVVGKYVKPRYVRIEGYDGNGFGNSSNAPGAGSGTFSATADTSGAGSTVTTNAGTLAGTPAVGMAILHASTVVHSGGFDWPTTVTSATNNGDGTWTLGLSKPLNGGGAAGTAIVGNLRYPYGVQVYSCAELVVEGGPYPYWGASVRFESGFPAASDRVNVSVNPRTGTGSSSGLMLVDADGKITPGPRQPQLTGQWRYEKWDSNVPADDPRPGVWNTPGGNPIGPTAVAGVANQAQLSRTVLPRAKLITSIGLSCRAAATNDDTIDFCIFDPLVSTTTPIWHCAANSANGKMKDLTGAASGVNAATNKVVQISAGSFMSGYSGSFLLLQPNRVYYVGLLYTTITAVGATLAQFTSWNWQDAQETEVFGAVQPYVSVIQASVTVGQDSTSLNIGSGISTRSTAFSVGLRTI